MALTNSIVAAGREEEDAAEDLVASSSSLWPPRTVVKRHRKKATIIWISLLVAFSVYVAYIVWDTIDARKRPAASVELKQSPFTFPDVAVCANFLSGCLKEGVNCLEDMEFKLLSQSGFMEDAEDFITRDDPDVRRVTNAFSHCAVMPLSKLTVNETGVNNGDVNNLRASFYMIWNDDPEYDFNSTEHTIYSQYITVHFIDIQQDVDQIGEKIVDAKLPYERLLPSTDRSFTSTWNHMVISMEEFSGITKTGSRKDRERTYSQTTTSGKDTWYWTSDLFEHALSLLQIEMLITKFEYTTVQEVDPVDPWAIIGAVGGVWQFVVVAFGVFFVFSEKQPPDKKMRDFYDTVVTPAVKINKRLSGITTSSRSSQQDVDVDAADEDLPPGWVKKQRKSGSMYYFHTMTGSTSVNPPDERRGSTITTGATAAPQRSNGLHRMFRSGSRSLPPGWVERRDGNGRPYFMDTVGRTTQWNWPAWRASSGSGSGVQAVDAPMRRSRRQISTDSSLASAPPTTLPPPYVAATGGAVCKPLPPDWESRTTPDGMKFYTNTVTNATQWEHPCNPV